MGREKIVPDAGHRGAAIPPAEASAVPGRLRAAVSSVLASAWFAYATILLLQLKVMWGAWRLRDLTSGDTTSYFVSAYTWFRDWHVPIIWSPLYTSFYGMLLYFSSDAYVVTTAHRLIAALAASLLVLAVLRRLVPPNLAWLMAAWWVILPIGFDTLYEVHLFAVLPVMAALLVILAKPGSWGRGWGTAALLTAAVLMRNELTLAAVVFGGLSIAWDWRQKTPGWTRAYLVPAVAALLVIGLYVWRANDRDFRGSSARKHTLNVCQIYAFGYQQRYTDWSGSPWTDCQQLMTRDYGVPEPSLTEALRRNPKAMLEHLWWNATLIPNGLQVLLLNAMSGSVNPDYAPVTVWRWPALAASLLLLGILGAGLTLFWRERARWWPDWIRPRIWGWIAMASVAIVATGVMLTQRPRPSYMLPLGICIRAAVGMCLFLIVRRMPRVERWIPAVPPVLTLAILLAPSYYEFRYSHTAAPRPLHDIYERLKLYGPRLEKPGTKLVVSEFGSELCAYLAKSNSTCVPLYFQELRTEVTASRSWKQVLDSHAATLLYLNRNVLAEPEGRDFVAHAAQSGWRESARGADPADAWAVFERLAGGRE